MNTRRAAAAVKLILGLALGSAVLAGAAAGQTTPGATARTSAGARHPVAGTSRAAEDEVFYQIFTRSYRDSDGDGIGDLRGIEQSLPYLRRLGITSILLTPICPSPFYHNYFCTSFEGVEPTYGGPAALTSLVRAVHAGGMKIYLDEEIQYVAEGHPWWTDSQGNPASAYSRFIPYEGPGNTRPMSAVFDLTTTPTWDGRTIGLATLNLAEPAVRAYFEKVFAALVDPDGNGRFDDGVDGFRIDHMMDDLDGRRRFRNLFADFWAPIFARARAANPKIRIIGEQADWGFGDDFLRRGGVDLVFAFPLRGAIVKLDAHQIADALAATAAKTPAGKGQLVFIENHDVARFATEVGNDPARLRAGAALNLLFEGTPLIYYGQELGMMGRRHDDWTADGNDIPDREAFEWGRTVDTPGSAVWYRGDGPWWSGRFARDDDGVSVEEQTDDPRSLLAFYRRLIALRRSRSELRAGDQRVLPTDRPQVLAVQRRTPRRATLLLVNLADTATTVTIPAAALPRPLAAARLTDLLTGTREQHRAGTALRVELPRYGVKLLSNR